MRKLLTLALLLLAAVPSLYARERAYGFCTAGGVRVYVSNVGSSAPAPSFAPTYWQQSYPNCTVTVYLSGTLTLATLYSDNSGTPLTNPFTANSNGYWAFYADDGRYDARFSGTSSGITTPFTLADILLCDPATGCGGGGGGGLTPHNLLSSTHQDTVPYSPPVAGDTIYSLLTPGRWQRFAGNTAAVMKVLAQVGNGTSVISQQWLQIGGTCGSNPVTAVNADGSVVCGTAGITGIGVDHGGVLVGTRPTINFSDGGNLTWTITDDSVNNRINITQSVAGGGTGCTVTNVAGQVLYDSGTGCGENNTFIGGTPNGNIWQIQKGGNFRFQSDDAGHPTNNYIQFVPNETDAIDTLSATYGKGANWTVDNGDQPIVGTPSTNAFTLTHNLSHTGNGIGLYILQGYKGGSADFNTGIVGQLIQGTSSSDVGKEVGLQIGTGFDSPTDNWNIHFWNEGASCSDGSTDVACSATNTNSWASFTSKGKVGIFGDLILQPEATSHTFPGVTGLTIKVGNMSQVTCTIDNRGRIHYVNSGSGVADILEICAKTAADTYTWVALGGSYVSIPGIAPTFQSLTDAAPITWNLNSSYISNGIVTLNHTTTTRALSVSGMQSGGVYNLVALQDATGGAALTLGTGCTWYVNNVATSTLGLATTASTAQRFSWIYDGSRCFVDTTAGGGGGSSGLAYLGTWLNTTAYATNNIVSLNGSSYIALSNNTGVQPGTDGGVTWAVLAVAGAQGPAGPSGTNGTNGSNGAPGAPGYSPNQILSGCGVAYASGLSFNVSACSYVIQNVTYGSPAATVTLTAADPSLDRIDVIAVNTSGVATVITGTPASNPAPPSVDINSQLQLTFAYVAAGASTPSNITTTDLYHENAEWTCASSAHVVCNSTSNPHSGTVDIEATAPVAGNYARLTIPSGTIDISQSNNLVFWIRSKAAWSGTSLTLQWYNGTTAKCTPVSLANGNFGFSSSNITTYQQIVVPTSVFACAGIPVTRLQFTLAGASTTGFYLDDIILQGGLPQSSGSSGMRWAGPWASTTTYAVNDTVTYQNLTYTAIQASTNLPPATNPTSWAVHSFSVAGSAGNLQYKAGTNLLAGFGTTISGTSITFPGDINYAGNLISTDTVNNTFWDFITGSSGDSTCPTPLAGHSYFCNISGVTNLSNNGGAYAPVVASTAPGTGTVTSIATTSPITGGTITTTGTIACPTCTISAAALTSGSLIAGAGLQAEATLVADPTQCSAGQAATGIDKTGAAKGCFTPPGSGGGLSFSGINNQTGTSYTLVIGDAAGYVRMNNASSNTITVPPNSSVAFTVGTVITINQVGVGQTTIAAGAGVTINTPTSLSCRAQRSTISIVKVGTNEWDAMGDLQ